MAFLAPTTVLAAQHLRVLRKRMPEVRVESEPEPEPDPKPDPNPDPNPNPNPTPNQSMKPLIHTSARA